MFHDYNHPGNIHGDGNLSVNTMYRHTYIYQLKYQFFNLSVMMRYEMQKVYSRGSHSAIKSKDKGPFCTSFRPNVIFGYVHMFLVVSTCSVLHKLDGGEVFCNQEVSQVRRFWYLTFSWGAVRLQ